MCTNNLYAYKHILKSAYKIDLVLYAYRKAYTMLYRRMCTNILKESSVCLAEIVLNCYSSLAYNYVNLT